jgi:hypothetical protein
MASFASMPALPLLIGLCLLIAVPPAPAADLPPQEAPAYTGVYRMLRRGRDRQDQDWKYVTEDTVTIAVLNEQSRWDQQKDGSTVINDFPTRSTLSFGGKVPAGTAVRSIAPFVAINWERGYANVAKATKKEPEVLGVDTIAGQECTRLRYISVQYGEPEFCVAKSGIVLRFTNKSADADARYEATSITEAAPDPERFKTPKHLKVTELGEHRPFKVPF